MLIVWKEITFVLWSQTKYCPAIQVVIPAVKEPMKVGGDQLWRRKKDLPV